MCVRKARPQHPLVPGAHQPARIFRQINDRQEVRCQFPVLVFHREVFLVIAHHRHENFIRQIQELLVEITQYDAGILVQVTHEVLQRGIFVDVEAALARQLRQFPCDLFAPLLRAHDHAIGAQLLFVLRETLDGQFAPAQ